jgi:hypothetical protein
VGRTKGKKTKAKDRVVHEDADTVQEAAEVQMLLGDVLTPYLGECLCVRMMAGPGELCTTCGGHVGSLEFNGICSECDLSSGLLLNCFACNLSFHRGCMPNLCWGLTGITLSLTLAEFHYNPNPNPYPIRHSHLIGFALPAPWCADCYQDWADFGSTDADPLCLVRYIPNRYPSQQA